MACNSLEEIVFSVHRWKTRAIGRNDLDDTWISFVACTLSSGGGFLLARRIRGRKRQLYYAVALWALLSFVSFLLVLVINAAGIDWYYFDDVAVGALYTYFMEDSRYFNVESK